MMWLPPGEKRRPPRAGTRNAEASRIVLIPPVVAVACSIALPNTALRAPTIATARMQPLRTRA